MVNRRTSFGPLSERCGAYGWAPSLALYGPGPTATVRALHGQEPTPCARRAARTRGAQRRRVPLVLAGSGLLQRHPQLPDRRGDRLVGDAEPAQAAVGRQGRCLAVLRPERLRPLPALLERCAHLDRGLLRTPGASPLPSRRRVGGCRRARVHVEPLPARRLHPLAARRHLVHPPLAQPGPRRPEERPDQRRLVVDALGGLVLDCSFRRSCSPFVTSAASRRAA